MCVSRILQRAVHCVETVLQSYPTDGGAGGGSEQREQARLAGGTGKPAVLTLRIMYTFSQNLTIGTTLVCVWTR